VRDLCPDCGHEAHSMGDRECEEGVAHGSKSWHRCLCLNRHGADKACPSLMGCQGGPLGYADLYNLQRGSTVHGEHGKIYTPSLLTGDGSRRVGYRSRKASLMLRCLAHAPEDHISGLDWYPVTVSDVQASLLRQTCSYPGCGVNVLEVVPAPASATDQAAFRDQLVLTLNSAFQTFVSPLSDAGEGLELSEHLADAVLAVPTAPTDRAAILHELADEAEECDGHLTKQELRRKARLAERTNEHHAVNGIRYLCHTGDHYCPQPPAPVTQPKEA
jgi:hypothetical protein